VEVEAVSPEQLRAGDLVVLRTTSGPLIHRYLGTRPDGTLRTKGDGHRLPDPPQPPEALVGRANALLRDGQRRDYVSPSLPTRVYTGWQRLSGWLWQRARYLWHWLTLILLLLAVPYAVRASVTLVYFRAEPQPSAVQVTWKTASETSMAYFVLERGTDEFGSYSDVSGPIPAEGDYGGGATYAHTDSDIVEQVRYYYRLKAVEIDGSHEYHGPINACLNCPTPTPTLTPTQTPTPTPQPTATAPPQPTEAPPLYVRFWSDATSLQAGDCTVLRWQTDNAARITLNGEGVPGPYSERQVCPCSDTDYVLGVSGLDGSYEEQTIGLSVSGRCSTQLTSPAATPTATSRPTRTATPRPTRTPFADAESDDDPGFTPTPSSTPSPAADRDLTPTPTRPVGNTSPLATPSPTPMTARPFDSLVPTRTPPAALTSPLSPSPQENTSRVTWMLPLLGLGGLFIALGGWGLWRAWKAQS
jgi:hypothetical protein